MPTGGFISQDGVPYFGYDHDDDGGFEQFQLATSADVSRLYETGAMVVPVSAFIHGDLTTGQNKFVWPVPPSFSGARIAIVELACGTTPTGGPIVIDINLNGDSIYANQALRPRIMAGTKFGVGPTPNTTAIGESPQILTIDIDQVGTTSPGANLGVVISLDTITPIVAGDQP